MKRTPITVDTDTIPSIFHPLLKNAQVYDSSSSPAARVYFLDTGSGFYLKTAAKHSLRREAEMTRFFHSRQLAAEVLAYDSLDADWLLTPRIPGEDCLHPQYLEDPKKLCDTTAQLLRMLHDLPIDGCPVSNRTAEYLAAARHNYESGAYDITLFPDNWGYATAEEALLVLENHGSELRADTLLHGDYCLPNIMLDNWKFSAFLDLANGGVGDRHIDLFWSIWSLAYNLKTDRYRDRFLDVYGRQDVCEEIFPIIAAAEVFG